MAGTAYRKATREGHLATARGHAMTDEDRLREAMISDLMCNFAIDIGAVADRFGLAPSEVTARLDGIGDAFPEMLGLSPDRIEIRPEARPLTRMIARFLDAYAVNQEGHSAAI